MRGIRYKNTHFSLAVNPRKHVPSIPMSDKRPEQVVGENVRRLRKERGWSQEDLASRMTAKGLNWRQTTVAKTESATRPLRVDEFMALSKVFDVGPAWFFSVTMSDSLSAAMERVTSLHQEADQQRSVVTRLEHQRAAITHELAEAVERLESLTAEAQQALIESDELRNHETPAHPDE